MMKLANLSAPLSNPLCVALDVDSREQALSIAQELKGIAGGYKLGPRLIHRYGADLVQEMARCGPIFVDCKFFDIPSTMVAAVQSSFDAGASLVTIHALSGVEALQEMARLESKLNQIRPFRILAVTILTSWGSRSFPPVFKSSAPAQNVLDLASFVKTNGLGSIVCSGEELSLLAGLDLFKLTPGIRPKGSEAGDQVRVMTPAEAIRMGSSALVVGRPILSAPNKREFAESLLAEITSAIR